MSMCYWMCTGIGVRSSVLYPLLNGKKCYDILKEQYPEEVEEDFDEDLFDIDVYFRDYLYNNLGEFLCSLDDTDSLSWDDNGDSETYFYYSPSYPWDRKKNEPVSKTEVHERIIDVLIQVTDLTRKEAEILIDDSINDIGCG